MARTKSSSRETDTTYSRDYRAINKEIILTYLRELKIPGVIANRTKSGIQIFKDFEPVLFIKNSRRNHYSGITLELENTRYKCKIPQILEGQIPTGTTFPKLHKGETIPT